MVSRRNFVKTAAAVSALPVLSASRLAKAANLTDGVTLYVPYGTSYNPKVNAYSYGTFFWGPDKNIDFYRYDLQSLPAGNRTTGGAYFDGGANPWQVGDKIYMFAANGAFARRIVIPFTQDWGASAFDPDNYVYRGSSGNPSYIDMDQSHYDTYVWPMSPFVYGGNVYAVCHHEFYPVSTGASGYNPLLKKNIVYPTGSHFDGCVGVNWINAITLLKSTDGGAHFAPDPLNLYSPTSQSNRCILTPMPSSATRTSSGVLYFEEDPMKTQAFGFFHPTNVISETINGTRWYYVFAEYVSRQRAGLSNLCSGVRRVKHGYVAVRTTNPSTAMGWQMFGASGTWVPIDHGTWQGDILPGVGGQEPYVLFDSDKGWAPTRFLSNVRKVGSAFVGIGVAADRIGFLAVSSLADPRDWESWGYSRMHVVDSYSVFGLKTIRKGSPTSPDYVVCTDYNPHENGDANTWGVNFFHPFFYGTNYGVPYDPNFEYINPASGFGGFLFGNTWQKGLTHSHLFFQGL